MTNVLDTGTQAVSGYAPVNGLEMYYEIEGTGAPLVYIPPAFGFAGVKSFPALAGNRAVLTVDLQGHGRTADIPERPLSIEQYASDVVGLLEHLGIARADFFGESYGAAAATMIAVHHPELVRRIATYGATFGPPQRALRPHVLHIEEPPTPDSIGIRFQRDGYRQVAPDPDHWPTIWSKVAAIQWSGFSAEELGSIRAPFLLIVGDHDFVRLEHAVEVLEIIPAAELAVIPDASHFVLFSEPERVIAVVKHFLEKSDQRIPLATPVTGYQPGRTR